MSKLFLILSLLVSGGAFAQMPFPGSKYCGQARADLQVCLLWDAKLVAGTLYLDYASGEHYAFGVKSADGAPQGVAWYTGETDFRGEQLEFWLSAAYLPGQPYEFATLNYRRANGDWQGVLGTGQFTMVPVPIQ